MVAFWERDLHPEGGDREWYTEPLSVSGQGGTGIGVRLQSVWGSTLTSRLMGSYNDKTGNPSFSVYDGYINDGPSRSVHSGTFISSGRITGTGEIALMNNMSSFGISPASKKTFQGDLTYYKSGWVGAHELQTGLFYQSLNGSDEIKYPNGGFAARRGRAQERQQSRPPATPRSAARSSASRRSSRTRRRRPTSGSTSRTPGSRRRGSRSTWACASTGSRPTEQIFNVQFQDAWHVGPRVGGTYVLTADGKNIARASYARVHEMPMPRNLGSVGAASSTVTNYYDNNLDGVFETVLVTPGSTSAQSDRFPDPNHHQPFIDEWTLGYSRQLPAGVKVGVDYAHREYKDLPALVETNGIYDGKVFKGYKNEAFNQIYAITNNSWNRYVYDGISLNASKRGKRLQILGAYTRAFQHNAGTWQPNDPASFIQPDAFDNDKGIGSIRGNQTNSLSGTADTRSPSWQKHNFRLGGTYLAPKGFVLALNYSLPVRRLLGPGRDEDRRGRSAVRPVDRHALERPRGREPAGDDDPVRRADPR